MDFNSPGIQHLACTFIKSVVNSGHYDIDALEDLPSITITALTGRPLQVRGKTNEECLAELNYLLTKPHPDSLLSKRLADNCRIICKAMLLGKECEPLLQLSVLCSVNFGLADFISNHLYYTTNKLNVLVASALGIDLLTLEAAILAISKTGLFPQACNEVIGILHLPKTLVNNVANIDAKNFKELVSGCFEVLPKSELSLTDYPHINLDFLTEFMKLAASQRLRGVNIFLFGPSGTGKTQLSMLLAQSSRCNLMTVKAQGNKYSTKVDELTSDLNSASLRLQYLGLLEAMLANEPKTMLLIDECEDVFYEYLSGKKISKDRLHHILTNNLIPTIWITNHPEVLPESCIRRFTYSLQVPTGSAAQKTAIVTKPLKGLKISSEFKLLLGSIEDLAIGHVAQAANVAKLLKLKGNDAEECVFEHITNTLDACGIVTSVQTYHSETEFNPDYINIKGDDKSNIKSIKSLTKAVKQFSGVRCMLSGVPGSGKSGLVHYLADELQQELIVIQPADILDKYVGGSEKRIKSLFEQAHQQNKMILIDECDSVLRSRKELNNQWERSVVNQLLLSLERCTQTTFLCSNFNGELDSALNRRIDYKVQLDYLTPEQTVKIYEENFGKCTMKIRNKLRKLTKVTPGDIAIVSRRNSFSKDPLSDTENLEILTTESNRKQQNQSIGFVH